MFIHDPEFIYRTPYCTGCDTTFLFFEVSTPGDRTRMTLHCPTCGKELGTVEEDTRLLAQAKGNVGDEVFKFVAPEVEQEIEQLTKPWEPKEEDEVGLVTDEELPSPYPGFKPSEVTNYPWIHAQRKSRTGTYPARTDSSGKWLVFVNFQKVNALWAKIKQATEEGRLGSAAKVATACPNPNAKDPTEKVICVYTYDWTDEEDVRRVREELRGLGITQKIPYKADQDTRAGKYAVAGHTRISKYYE